MADLYKIQYANNTLTYPGWNGFLQYADNSGPTYEYTTLWETNDPFKNLYSITLSDDIRNYDEYIVYGTANRDNQCWLDTQNRYVVNKTGVNQGGPFYCGQWNTGSTYFLMSCTDMWLSGTSGYVNSSFFMGQNNGSTAWCNGTYNTARQVDLHPYKIVGIKEIV